MRWALFEAAKVNARESSPGHDCYVAVRERLAASGGRRPGQGSALAVARRLARRYYTLREFGDRAWTAIDADQPLLPKAA